MSERRDEERAARLTREIAARAARRLDYLEWVILGAAILAAVGGGALVALLLSDLTGLPYRSTWIVASLLLFGVPGTLALRRARREERAWRERIQNDNEGQGPDV